MHVTPALTEGVTKKKIYTDFLLQKKIQVSPQAAIPSIHTDFQNLPLHEEILIWLGHSTYFIQVQGMRFLVDPILAHAASPFSWCIKPFQGSDIYTPDMLPSLDAVLITHDHWDHLDYDTITQLIEKTDLFICGLGVGAHLAYWGVDTQRIREKDWNEHMSLSSSCGLHILPAHHYSGRALQPNQTLWVSFLLELPDFRIYCGGDSAYGSHFKKINTTFGAIDLAILENGQYDPKWKYSHMRPEEVLQAALDLQAAKLLPVHAGKFALSHHPWNEPYELLTSLSADSPFAVLTPKIGEPVYFKSACHQGSKWW